MRHQLVRFSESMYFGLGVLLVSIGSLATLGLLPLLSGVGVGLWVSWWLAAWRGRRSRAEALEIALLAIENQARATRAAPGPAEAFQALHSLTGAMQQAMDLGVPFEEMERRLALGGIRLADESSIPRFPHEEEE